MINFANINSGLLTIPNIGRLLRSDIVQSHFACQGTEILSETNGF